MASVAFVRRYVAAAADLSRLSGIKRKYSLSKYGKQSRDFFRGTARGLPGLHVLYAEGDPEAAQALPRDGRSRNGSTQHDTARGLELKTASRLFGQNTGAQGKPIQGPHRPGVHSHESGPRPDLRRRRHLLRGLSRDDVRVFGTRPSRPQGLLRLQDLRLRRRRRGGYQRLGAHVSAVGSWRLDRRGGVHCLSESPGGERHRRGRRPVLPGIRARRH